MVQIQKAIGSSPLLRNKKELIEEFVRRYATDREVSQQWAKYVSDQAQRQLDELIEDEKLNPEQTVEFMRHSFHIGEVERNGDRITKCLPPLPLFAPNNQYATVKKRVLDRLCEYFDRFYDIYEFAETPLIIANVTINEQNNIHIDQFNQGCTNITVNTEQKDK